MRETDRREAEDKYPVTTQIARHGLKVDPAKDERKRDGRRQQAAPHDEDVGEAARPAPPPDELVEKEDLEKPPAELPKHFDEPAALEKGLPAAPPVHARRRALQPHEITIAESESCEQRSKRIADERGIDLAEVTRADEDGRS